MNSLIISRVTILWICEFCNLLNNIFADTEVKSAKIFTLEIVRLYVKAALPYQRATHNYKTKLVGLQ